MVPTRLRLRPPAGKRGRAALRRLVRPRAALIALGIVVSVFFAYLAVRHVQAHETWRAFRTTNYAWVVPAVALLVLAFYMRAIRWWALFEPSRRPPLGPVIRATFVGYLGNNLLPARAGEAAKALALYRSARTPIAESVATILIERIYDVLSLILLLFLMLPGLPSVSWLRGAGVVAAIGVVCVAAASFTVLRYGERPIRVLLRPLHWLPFVPDELAERAPALFVHGLAGVLRARVAALALAWTIGSWIVLGVSYWLVLIACHLHLSPLTGELVVVGIGLAMVLPSSPGALGVFEAATVVVLGAYQVDNSPALSYALLLHALNVLPLFVVALAGIAWKRIRAVDVVPVEEAPQIAPSVAPVDV